MTTTSSLSGQKIARSAVWNFAGMAGPMLVGLAAIPYLIDEMGKERFGLLAIIWMGVGYFSLFDMGLGRTLTKLVAERIGRNEDKELPAIIWTALCLILCLGVIGMITVFLLAEPLITHVLNVPLELVGEGMSSFRLLAVSIPFVIATSALIGILEAHQRFAVIAALRMPLGVITFLGPVFSLLFSTSLVDATAVLVAARGMACIFYYIAACQVSPALKQPRRIAKVHLRPLLSFGSWLTITNIIGPMLSYLDRFLIGAVTSIKAVAFYATPYDVLSRLQMLPQSIMGVMFPALATVASNDPIRLPKLYGQITHVLFLLVLPIMSSIFLFAPEALGLWLGNEFRVAAAPVVHWLSLGWMVNALARPAFTVLQSVGRPDIIAKIYLAEFAPYVALLWFLTSEFGIVGAAAVWFLRTLLDTIILNDFARRIIPELSAVVWKTQIAILCILSGFLAAWFVDSFWFRVSILLIILLTTALRFHLKFLPMRREKMDKAS